MVDEEVERAQKGDPDAMQAVLTRIAPNVARFGRQCAGNPTDADDVVQETLIAVATHLPAFEGRSSLSTWVYTLARTACARRRRGAKNAPTLPESSAPERADPTNPEILAERAELSSALSSALASLPIDQREVVVLRDMEGLTAPEVAEALGLSVAAVKSRLHRGRQALRATLGEFFQPHEGCPDIALQISKKLEGELTASDVQELEKHVSTCKHCDGACHELLKLLSSARATATHVVDAETQALIAKAFQAWTASPAPKS
ncbi:MAG: sigma-70 family RNA polymerase sigma factor [Deltaproteobacteria bacterium]|nr:sigma-70 family RNA polymerase sigma factor [Deltaproteobacteria bacterium]